MRTQFLAVFSVFASFLAENFVSLKAFSVENQNQSKRNNEQCIRIN